MASSPTTLHLVDSIEYAETNCFQHQLLKALRGIPGVRTVSLAQLAHVPRDDYDAVVCCLKQRTLSRYLDHVVSCIGPTPIVTYDQDPWEAFRDGSPFKGVYEEAMKKLNVKAFAVTTRPWAEMMQYRDLPGVFVRMWVQPEYCTRGPAHVDRKVSRGFVGALHPYRKALFDRLDGLDLPVDVVPGGLSYAGFMQQLTQFRVYVHAEESPVVVDNIGMDLRDGLWIKDVEAMAAGCFSVRNAGADHDSYTMDLPKHDGLTMLRTYGRPEDVPSLLRDIERMDPDVRQSLIDRTVEEIRRSPVWEETAHSLVTMASEEA